MFLTTVPYCAVSVPQVMVFSEAVPSPMVSLAFTLPVRVLATVAVVAPSATVLVSAVATGASLAPTMVTVRLLLEALRSLSLSV